MKQQNFDQNSDQTEEHVLKSPSLAEISLKYKSVVPQNQMPTVTSPEEAVSVLRTIWDEDTIQLKEEFVVLLLNNAKKCLGWSKISSGGGTATIVDPATIYQIALLANANSIIVAHNHPSGNLNVSQADKTLTRRIRESGDLLGIRVDDHIILTIDNYLSFQDKRFFER